MARKLIAVVGAAILTVALAGRAPAQEVAAYMGTSPENNVQIVNFIKDKTGITVKQTFQSFGEIEARVKAEAPNFNADMIIGCGSPLAFMARKNGWSIPYVSPAWKGVSDVFIDPQGAWYNIANFSFVLVGNKDRLAKAGFAMPKSWKDLLDPKWKGEIVMPSPFSSGTANMMRYSFLALYGDAEGWKFIEALDKNIHHYTRSGNAPTDLVGRGEFMLGLTSDENVKKRLDDGYPLLWSIPEEGTGYDGTFALILKGTTKLEATKKIIDALGTPEFSTLLAGVGYITPRPAPNALYGSTPPRYIKIDLAKAAEDRPKNNDIWKSKLRSDFR
ncbi:MAG TPA: extracellular solute-binding protein [Methylomirabilota bacterium]|jgi:iron(III) transport system substrate-binding protein|nr:extracellular solute-binding protein [Methylomirabilota bacterium]